MQQFTTTEEFIYRGRPLSGIPLLVDKDEYPVSPFTNYMMHLALERGRITSDKTLKSHADALYDYFSWLRANGLTWDREPKRTPGGKEISNLSLYQNWSKNSYRKPDGTELKNTTINLRTSRIEAFYRWAKDIAGLIDWLPFITKIVAVSQGHPDALAHTHGQRVVESSESRLPTFKVFPKLLNVDQVRELHNAPMSKTIKLAISLILATGLRNVEARSFPRKYIFDPRGRDPRKRIRIDLDPNDIELKNSKPRTVYVSWQLMMEMYQYVQAGEGAERGNIYRNREGTLPTMLLLNHLGKPFADKGLNDALRALYKGKTKNGKFHPPVISFRTAPHMLRHTFATLELYAESEAIDKKTGRKRGLGHALGWVRDRLGHSNIQTTTIYVHCLQQMETPELNEWQETLSEMLGEGTRGA